MESCVHIILLGFPFGTETFLGCGELGSGTSEHARLAMTLPSARDVFLTVAIASTTLLIEIGVFILVGMI